MNKILLGVMILFFSFWGSGCKNEMKYVLLNNSENLYGYVIFQKEKCKNLCYFDLGQNKVFEIDSVPLRMINSFLASYDFYKDGDKMIMINYVEQNHKLCLQFIELKFSNHLDMELLASKEVKNVSVDKIIDKFRYLYKTHELYYYSYYDLDSMPRLINIDTFETKEFFSQTAYTPYPVDFFDKEYLALNSRAIYFCDKDKIEVIQNDSNAFIEGMHPRYSAVLRKVIYRGEEEGKRTMRIFDIESLQITDTGITPLKYDRVDSDKEKFHFFGERYILYARFKEKSSNLARWFYQNNIVLPAFLNPVEYMIYDYINGRDIGYIENCQLNAVYDFFPAELCSAEVH